MTISAEKPLLQALQILTTGRFAGRGFNGPASQACGSGSGSGGVGVPLSPVLQPIKFQERSGRQCHKQVSKCHPVTPCVCWKGRNRLRGCGADRRQPAPTMEPVCAGTFNSREACHRCGCPGQCG
jgi:hypothetical protein